MSAAVDSTGRPWFPRRGDCVREFNSHRTGVVLDVRQTASAPAYVTVALETDDRGWTIATLAPAELELDTSDDVELPSFAERRATMGPSEAAAIITGSLVELGFYRARVTSDEDLVGVLETETHRALALARHHTENGRYDLAQRERELASHMRELACAVTVQLAERPSCG